MLFLRYSLNLNKKIRLISRSNHMIKMKKKFILIIIKIFLKYKKLLLKKIFV